MKLKKFSILISTYNNLKYLQICLNSIKKNSLFKSHEIIIHINDGSDGTLDYIKRKNFLYSYSKKNIGLCSSINNASKKANTNLLIYSHDDMYFCPGWDYHLSKEVNSVKTDKFYFSASMIEPNGGHIKFNCGNTFKDFDEKKLLCNLSKLPKIDYQGSHWAPHLIHKKLWDRVGGFSEEFNPGFGSDPDLNMKLWLEGVRIFKGLGKFQVYHFGSITLRKKKFLKTNNGSKTFLKKWKITPKFFIKYYLRGGKFINNKIVLNKYEGQLSHPIKNVGYYFDLLNCKLKFFILKLSM